MTEASPVTAPDIEQVFRQEYGRAVAALVRTFGDIDLAEEAVQEAFTAAVERWPSAGLPPAFKAALHSAAALLRLADSCEPTCGARDHTAKPELTPQGPDGIAGPRGRPSVTVVSNLWQVGPRATKRATGGNRPTCGGRER